MRPEKVVEWREQLPPPFDKPFPPLRRSSSAAQLDAVVGSDNQVSHPDGVMRRRRRDSAPDTVDQVDRRLNWLRFIHDEQKSIRREKSKSTVVKLRRLQRAKSALSAIDSFDKPWSRSLPSITHLEEPTREELLSLANECFPPMHQCKVIITNYSENALCRAEYTLEEVLESKFILQPSDAVPRIRWIFVEYYKIGTFWGSDFRFSQWGTDPTLFEKSPVALLLDRLAELDCEARRSPPEDLPDYKRIGKYHRQKPGCPEYLGLRVNSSAWFKSEPYELLLDFLDRRPSLLRDLQRSNYTDLEYGTFYLKAVQCLKESAYSAKPGLRELHNIASVNDAYLYGNWDDTVERVEFYGENTLVSCGSPRFYEVVAERLNRREDVLRQFPDCALLYYTLARVSIENDEMMQDTPERALNKVFASLISTRSASRKHAELLFSLQQAVIDGLEYLEENRRELPIWGIPPFDNHQVSFHPDHNPNATIRTLIQEEMNLVEKDFNTIIGHWKSLRSKVERYLDVLLQFRVLEQQELAVRQSHIATQQQILTIDEARRSRTQSRAVFLLTSITIVFVPLSFFTSYFGMNFTDIAGTAYTSTYFWMTAAPTSAIILIAILAVMKFFKVVGRPVPDEESATTRDEIVESKRPWHSRWRRMTRKQKAS